ncbi:heparan-alpha-glucosaminide N-acetyltransferase [Methylocystis bryophila]|uniref:heparan-alpha-glucosaminide N-acetyltransferase n=1 Tax=Methylocystis bryophila TaxID=655015 RepID=UPI003CCA381E
MSRLLWLDAARGFAVVAMVAYHFVWDLGNFDYIDRYFPYSAQFKSFGHAIALSFLFIAGVSLVLAHERNPSFGPFWRRLARIAAAAALVSLGTYLVFPQSFVFFGILHCIAAASLLAAPFLFLPWPASLFAAVAVFLAPRFLAAPVFDAPWLSWIGLSTVEPLTNDWRPLFPWSGALLAGVAFAKAPGVLAALGRFEPTGAGSAFANASGWLGRHSLAIYLLHQPLLFGVFLGIAKLSTPSENPFPKDFLAACEMRCEADGGAIEFCEAACGCVEARARDLPGEPAERALRLRALAEDCAKP